MKETSFEISGMEELTEELQKAVKIYPDCAEKMLEEKAIEFKKKVAERYKRIIKRRRTGKLTRGFRISKVKGFRTNMEIDFMAESKANPHFHLVENGHEMVTRSGNSLGRIDGYHVVEKTRSDYGRVMLLATAAMIDDILRESGLN